MNKQMMKLAGTVVAVIILVGAYYFAFIRQNAEYSIVYLSTGEVYVGHLSTFPRLKLTDGYIFQAVKDPADPAAKTTFQLNPLKEALWAPQYLYVNEEQVLFTGPLSETSSIYRTLKNPGSNPAPTPEPRTAPAEDAKIKTAP